MYGNQELVSLLRVWGINPIPRNCGFCFVQMIASRNMWTARIKNNMTRSSKKGPYVDPRVMKKIEGKKPIETGVIKTWSRACVIAPEMVGFNFGVHNGKIHIEVLVSEDMVGHRLGEFSPTKKFIKHGGKMQKDLEQKKKEGEIAAAQSAKTAATPGAKK